MWTEIIIVSIATLVLGVVGTLWWWRLADAWVPEKHRRFQDKAASPDKSNVVVIKSEDPTP
jgi:hypothetical protein